MKIFLADSPNAIEVFNSSSKYKDFKLIYHNCFKGYDPTNYIFEPKKIPPETGKTFFDFYLNWYRDDKRHDFSKFAGISWGNILSCSMMQSGSYLFKEFTHLSHLEPSEICIASSEHEYFKFLVQKMFPGKVSFYTSTRESLNDLYIQRKLILPRKHWTFGPLSLFNLFKHQKNTLVFKEGTVTDYYKDDHYFFINTKDIFKNTATLDNG